MIKEVVGTIEIRREGTEVLLDKSFDDICYVKYSTYENFVDNFILTTRLKRKHYEEELLRHWYKVISESEIDSKEVLDIIEIWNLAELGLRTYQGYGLYINNKLVDSFYYVHGDEFYSEEETNADTCSNPLYDSSIKLLKLDRTQLTGESNRLFAKLETDFLDDFEKRPYASARYHNILIYYFEDTRTQVFNIDSAVHTENGEYVVTFVVDNLLNIGQLRINPKESTHKWVCDDFEKFNAFILVLDENDYNEAIFIFKKYCGDDLYLGE